MTRKHLLCLLVLTACSDRLGPDLSPCSATPTPNTDFCGTWRATNQVMGSSLVMNLRIHDQLVAGGGSYAIEAGRRGTLSIDGQLRGQYVDLAFAYDYGAKRQYHGQFGPGNRITGALADSLGHLTPLSFEPR